MTDEAGGQSGTTGCVTSFPAAATVSHQYTALSDIDLTIFGNGEPAIDYIYDDNRNIIQINRGSNKRSFAYDHIGDDDLLKEDTLVIDGYNFTTLLGYTQESYLDWQQLPSSRRIQFAPNGLGQPTEAREQGGPTYASAVTYHPNGAVENVLLGNGRQHLQGLNSRQLPNRRQYQNGFDAHYTYDGNAQIKTIGFVTDNTGDRAFTYDGAKRLLSSTGPWGIESYTYDVLGNILSLDRSEDFESDSVTHALGYDDRGNVTNDGNHIFTYDLMNQPVTIAGATTGEFVYDGNLRRAKQVIGGQTIYSHYGIDGTLYHRLALSSGGLDDKETDFIQMGGTSLARITDEGSLTDIT